MVKYFKTKAQAKSWSDLIDYRKTTGRSRKLVHFEDKVKSKKIAASCGCPVPKTYYVVKDPAKIPFNKLPDQYVIKPSHLAGAKAVFLMKNGVEQFTKKKMSPKEIIRRQREYLTKQIDPRNLEWATGQIPRRTLVEEYVPGLSGDFGVPTDYKCYVFHGRVCMVRVDYKRRTKQQATDYYNRDFQIIDFDRIRTKYPTENNQPPKPPHYDWMIELAEKMGRKFGSSFLRIDMYLTADSPMFGEFTLYPGSGRGSKFTGRADRYMGSLWKNKNLVWGEGQVPFTKEHFYKVLNLDENGQSKKKSTDDIESVGVDLKFPKSAGNVTDAQVKTQLRIQEQRQKHHTLLRRRKETLEAKKKAREKVLKKRKQQILKNRQKLVSRRKNPKKIEDKN